MTEFEAMKKYGDSDGYVNCKNCPCYDIVNMGCLRTNRAQYRVCNGKTVAYDAIVKFFSDKHSENSESVEPTDMVNHPPHYTQDGIECIDEMIMVFGEATVMDFCLCNVWKYRKRALHKNGQEDLDKANWYMKKYKELLENGK